MRGVGAWDALRAYVLTGIRAPISPVPATLPDVVAGRALFIAANCQQCHGGNHWTSGLRRFAPPPAAGLIANGEIVGGLLGRRYARARGRAMHRAFQAMNEALKARAEAAFAGR